MRSPITRMATALAIVVALFGSVVLAGSSHAASGGAHRGPASRTHQTAPACAVVFIIGRQSCFAPSQAAQAVRDIPWAVSPDTAVASTLGLKLSQISINRMPSDGASNDERPVQVDYLYGPLQHDYGRMGAAPVAARVIESPGNAGRTTRMAPGFPMPEIRNACGTTIEISAAADPERAHPSYGPWFAIANFPHGNHSVGIVANIDKDELTTLTCRVLQAG